MSELARKIAERIGREGPIPFSVFMEMALYDEAHGYYLGDPFGKDGDFFTASQLQPVFGAYLRELCERLVPGYENFVDIGAGREELRESFAGKNYRAVQRGQKMPQTKTSVLFSNELIDALPVDLLDGGVLLRVSCEGLDFAWHPHAPRAGVKEVRPSVRAHLEEAWKSMERGCYVIADYGYRGREALRFEMGSLMSYRRHVASEEVLIEPGERDITAHVDWDRLIHEAREMGWEAESFGSLRASILELGPETLTSLNSLGEMQFRTLFFSLGESFEILVLRKS